jgi:hypothetical protein
VFITFAAWNDPPDFKVLLKRIREKADEKQVGKKSKKKIE